MNWQALLPAFPPPQGGDVGEAQYDQLMNTVVEDPQTIYNSVTHCPVGFPAQMPQYKPNGAVQSGDDPAFGGPNDRISRISLLFALAATHNHDFFKVHPYEALTFSDQAGIALSNFMTFVGLQDDFEESLTTML